MVLCGVKDFTLEHRHKHTLEAFVTLCATIRGDSYLCYCTTVRMSSGLRSYFFKSASTQPCPPLVPTSS